MRQSEYCGQLVITSARISCYSIIGIMGGKLALVVGDATMRGQFVPVK